MKTIFITAIFFQVSQIVHAGPLSDKANIFLERSVASQESFGLVGNSDDTPIWTGVYVASLAYRYESTHDPAALAQMEKSLWGLVTLHEITGTPGFFARKINPLTATLPDGFQPATGNFKGLMWKGKVSFDQYMGYLYGISEAWPYIQDQKLRDAVRHVISSIGHHFIDHKEKIQGSGTNLDFSPNIIKANPLEKAVKALAGSFTIRGGRAMYALHLLKVAFVVTGEPVFRDYYNFLVEKKNYAIMVRDYTQGHTESVIKNNIGAINVFTKLTIGTAVRATPDSLRADVAQNLGHIVGYNLARLEDNSVLHAYYVEGLRRGHEPIARHSNTYWNFLYSSLLSSDPQGITEGIDSLKRFPMNNYGARSNSSDHSIPKYKGLSPNFFKGDKWKWYSVNPLPFERRPMHSFAWQQNACEMDGNYSSTDAPGVAYLVAYWLGREHGWIGEND